MVSCSSQMAQCPPGFLVTSLLIVAWIAIALGALTWFMVRRIAQQLATGDIDDGTYNLFSLWPFFGPLSTRKVRRLARMGRWAPSVALVFGAFLLIGSSVGGGPHDLHIMFWAFVPVWMMGFGGMPWVVRRAV